MGKEKKLEAKQDKDKKSKGKTETPPEPQIPIRQKLFGNWTGKLPAVLLNEHCQKEQWEKPEYQFDQKSKGYSCTIVLGKRNKKTSQIDKVKFRPKDEYYPSQQLAKHSCATYALHRIKSHLNISNLLPPSQKELWQKYEGYKRDCDKDTVAYEYSPDPFKPVTHVQEAQVPSTPDEPWAAYPELHINKNLREKLEILIRSNLDHSHPVKETDSKMDLKYVKRVLLKKGFREAHVNEALTYRSDIPSAVDWLCIHVPEDDLPQDMRLTDTKSLSLFNHNQESLAREYVLKRLMRTGLPKSICLKHLEDNNMDEYLSISTLCLELISQNLCSLEVGEHLELREAIQEEIQVLESIFSDQVCFEENDYGVKFSFDLEVTGTIEIYISKNLKYPYHNPGIIFANPEKLPAYIRIGILKNVMMDLINQLGAPLIYTIISSIEEHAGNILQNPPLLATLYPKSKALVFDIKDGSFDVDKGSHKIVQKDVESENLRLLKEFNDKQNDLKYIAMLKIRKKLPSYVFKEKICSALKNTQALIICGETGCGKSTQLGQFILDDLITEGLGASCNIICTQPRRISAIGLADRVANERIDKVGNQIGYSIRGESKQSSNTKLLFCTTGVLLRMIQGDPKLTHVSHVIVDEVHERGGNTDLILVESDFLLVLLKDLLFKRKDLKVILMSATINADFFSSYFDCNSLQIPGFTHPVDNVYLEAILEKTGHVPENLSGNIKAAGTNSDSDDEFRKLFDNLSEKISVKKLVGVERDPTFKIDYGLITATVNYICDNNESGAILIFLPGIMEIKKCIDRIANDLPHLSKILKIFPLHSNLTSVEQTEVFKKVSAGMRKVVVSTNIAETSVTIDDVVFVVDTGRVKEMKLVNSVLSLQELWASKAACKQRRGRAGRVQPGIVYKLYSSYYEKKYMAANSEPEILRLPLEQLCLQIKTMGVKDVMEFLGKALSPPSKENIQSALDLLEKLGAFDENGELTALGKHISKIPADVKIAKMLIYGTIFNCVDPILTIAASLSGKSPFTSPIDKREEAAQAQKKFAIHKSDHLMVVNAYDELSDLKGKGEKFRYCDSNFISMTTMKNILDLRKQFKDILFELKYASTGEWDRININSGNPKIVKSVILAGLYPNVCTIKLPKQLYDSTAQGSVAIDIKSKEIKFFDKDTGRLFVHPSSSLFTEQNYDENVLVYSSKVATTKVFVRDCSVVPNNALLLLGGNVDMLHGGRALSIDNIRFQAFPRISSLVLGIRKLLDLSLMQKIADPHFDFASSPIGKLCLELLEQ
ncbi:hypothetical protein HDV01_005198 [Terramyces sp. JEL0728]|nr:hypothetical protein HDV01_005198 [Terramyces sp. JEL0728]